MAMHTQNLQADHHSSLFVPQPEVSGDPLGAARVTLLGRTGPAGPEDRSRYLQVHGNAQYWIDFEDFSLIRLEVEHVYFIGGFGVMGWIAAAEYAEAGPDPLVDDAPRILSHMNSDHADSLLHLARRFGHAEAEEARMLSIDRLGFEVRLKTGDRVHGTRISFPSEVKTVEECRTMLIQMSRLATPNP
jgi:putative heme iron utilization protein